MNLVKEYQIERYEGGRASFVNDKIISEYFLSIYVQNNFIVTLECIAQDLEELVVGYLYCESFISLFADIVSLNIDIEKGRADVKLARPAQSKTAQLEGDRGGLKEFIPEMILQKANLLLNYSTLFKITGNVHTTLLCQDERTLCFSEDIGRYNAFDKTIGKAIMTQVDLTSTTLYTSSRIPSSMLLKAVRCKIPLLVSRSAPSDKTLEYAEQFQLGIVGFAKDKRMNIYRMPRILNAT